MFDRLAVSLRLARDRLSERRTRAANVVNRRSTQIHPMLFRHRDVLRSSGGTLDRPLQGDAPATSQGIFRAACRYRERYARRETSAGAVLANERDPFGIPPSAPLPASRSSTSRSADNVHYVK